jgi:hypothetical protein
MHLHSVRQRATVAEDEKQLPCGAEKVKSPFSLPIPLGT